MSEYGRIESMIREIQKISEQSIYSFEEVVNYVRSVFLKPSTIEHSPTAVGWISVKDRLPEDESDVLVYGVSPRGRKKTAIMNYLAFDADRPRWALDGIWTVLYWMPLPEPPKE